MIKTKKGRTKIKASQAEAMADLACVVEAVCRHLLNTGFPKEDLKECIREHVEMAFAELEGRYEEFMAELALKKFNELISEIEKEKNDDHAGNEIGKLH